MSPEYWVSFEEELYGLMCEVAERYRRDLACLYTLSTRPPQTDKQTDTECALLAPMRSVLPDTQSSV